MCGPSHLYALWIWFYKCLRVFLSLYAAFLENVLRSKHICLAAHGPSFLISLPLTPSSSSQPVTPSSRLQVLGEGRLLQIQPTQVSDSGRYLCVATNVAGEDDQDFNVLIQGAWRQWARGGASASVRTLRGWPSAGPHHVSCSSRATRGISHWLISAAQNGTLPPTPLP